MCKLNFCPCETDVKLFEDETSIVWEKLPFEMEILEKQQYSHLVMQGVLNKYSYLEKQERKDC